VDSDEENGAEEEKEKGSETEDEDDDGAADMDFSAFENDLESMLEDDSSKAIAKKAASKKKKAKEAEEDEVLLGLRVFTLSAFERRTRAVGISVFPSYLAW
jgi:hypothetical protein